MKKLGATFFTFCFVLAMVMIFSGGVCADTWGGSGTDGDPYEITSVDDLAALAAAVNGGNSYENTYFELTSDLDLTEKYGASGSVQQGWTPIGLYGGSLAESCFFQGYFIGNDYKISGLYQYGYQCGGLFGLCKNGSIESLTVSGAIVAGENDTGGVVGYIDQETISDCSSMVNITADGRTYIGGVVGFSESSQIMDCVYNGRIQGYSYVGGIVGFSRNNQTLSNCTASGAIAATDFYVGGIAGGVWLNTEATEDIVIDRCVNEAKVKAPNGSSVGGIVGSLQNNSYKATGNTVYKVTLRNCVNYGTIGCGRYYVGGIAGEVYGYHVLIANCFNAGKIAFIGDDAASAQYFGGIVGVLYQGNYDANLTVTNCVNNGAVNSSVSNPGSIAGRLCGKTELTWCYWGEDCALTVPIGSNESATAVVNHNSQYGASPLLNSGNAVGCLNGWVAQHNPYGSNIYKKWINLDLSLTNVAADTKAGVQLITGPVGLSAMSPMNVKVKIDNWDKTGEVYTPGTETAAPYSGSVAFTKRGDRWCITASAEGATFDVTHQLTRITATADTAGEDKAAFADNYTTTLTADTGYLLPDKINVTIGGNPAANSAYAYSASSGELIVYGAYITGDIVVTATSYVGFFYLLGEKIGLPDPGEVIYGTVDDLDGSTALLTDASFTALTAGDDYTWWIYYDGTKNNWQLCLDGFVMTAPYFGGNVVACYEDRAFALDIDHSTLLGKRADCCIIYTAGTQNLAINQSTLIQNSEYGHIAAGNKDLTATVTDSTLTAIDDANDRGGNIFIVNYDDDSYDSALTATFSGGNTVTAYYDLLYYFAENEASTATLNVQDDFSFTACDDEAVESCGDIDVVVADDASLTIRSVNDFDEDYCAIASWYGDISVSGGSLMLSGMQNALYAQNGAITISDCTMEATGGAGYGAFLAAEGITLNHIGIISPEKGSIKSISTYLYYSDDDDDDEIDFGELRYTKYVAADNSAAYYDYVNDAAMTQADFDTAVAAAGIKAAEPYTEYTITDGIMGSVHVQLGVTYTADGYAVKSGDTYESLDSEVEVAYRTAEDAAKAQLPAAAYLKLVSSAGQTVYEPVTLAWSITDYDSETVKTYDATATAAYTNQGANYPGVATLADVTGKVTVMAANHKCASYSDRESWPDWAKPYICFAIENDLMIGIDKDPLNFGANATMSRGMEVQIIYNLAGSPEVTAADIATYNNKFGDVAANDWYYNAVVWAANHQVTVGTSSNFFSPNEDVTREQVVAFFWRYNGSPASTYSLAAFPDQAKVSSYAKTAFSWAVEKGIINGVDNSNGTTTLSPKANCTRAEMAVIITKYAKTCMSDTDWLDISQ